MTHQGNASTLTSWKYIKSDTKIFGGYMGKISQEKRMENYHKVYEQIYEVPALSFYDISLNTGLSRNTVSTYVKDMYIRHIIMGPHLRMNPHSNYKEYVYLMNFADPLQIFNGLKEFPHVVYHAMAFGDWNTMVVTDKLLDFSNLVGLEEIVTQGVRYCSYTPKVEYKTWDERFTEIYEQLDRFTPVHKEYKNRHVTFLPWREDEWKLFHAFKYNMRKKIIPTLRKINVPYETYITWMKTVHNHCTIHTGFYPEGYETYTSYCFLFSTDHEESVKSLCSLFPTTPFIIEVDNHLLVFIHVASPKVKRKLFCLVCDMETKRMIKEFTHTVVLFFYQHPP